MPEVYRESRYVRERDTSPSDDEGYKRTTVRRYKVAPDRVERVEREVDIVEEDRRSRYAPQRSSREDVIEVERRGVDRLYIPERPRSAFDPSPHSASYVERQVIEREREREPRDEHYTRVDRVEYRGDGARGAVVERERVEQREDRDRDDDYRGGNDRDRGRVVYESTKEVERVDRKDAYSPREWERRSYWDEDKETDVRIEKRVERDAHGGEVRVERRVEERRDDYGGGGGDVERWRKETEYYEPGPAPIVIRPRAAEQKIILQDAAPATVVIRGQNPDPRDVGRRGSRDGEFYYHRETREVGPYRGERREDDYALARYDDDRHRHHHHHSHHRHHRYSDAESDDGYYSRRRGERSASSSPHRKRHIAEGALAGAGISAILASRRDSNGEYRQHRGRKVLAGAAIGALGTEVARRAHSAYQERFGDEDERERSRSRSRPPHSKLKTGLGIAAVALAAAGAAKYLQSNKIEKEEMTRGRALHRDSDSERSPSRKRSKSRAASLAKVGLGTAAAVGLVQHYRHKSKSRDGKSRSRSRLRTGAEILAAGLAGAGAKKLYDRHKDKKEAEQERENDHNRDRDLSDDEYYNRDERDYHRRSGSMTRSGPTYPDRDSTLADPELGMVEYGAHPLHSEPPYPAYGNERGAAGYDSATEDAGRRHRRGHGGRSRGGDTDYSADSEAEADKKTEKKRSRSRLRDLAAGAAAAGAAAIGIKKYNDRKDKGKEKDEKDRERENGRERETDGERSRDRDRGRRERERERGKERDRRRYEEEAAADGYDNLTRRGASPPHASGGYYNPPPAGYPVPPAPANGFTQHPNVATTDLNQHYPPYPPDSSYTAYTPPMPGPPPGPPPNSAAMPGPPPGPFPNPATGIVPPPQTGPVPPPINPTGPEHVSQASHVGRSTPEPEAAVRSVDGDKKDRVNPYVPPPAPSTTPELEPPDTPRTSKSVVFIPLSPKSSATLRRHHEEQSIKSDTEDIASESDDGKNITKIEPSHSRRRRNSDTDDDEEAIEMLPDRFDAQGRPLDGPASSRSSTHRRGGEFEYRSPRGAEGTNVRGAWGVAGTDAEAVERIVRDVTGVLEGRGSWMGLIGGILSGSLLKGPGGGDDGGGQGRIADREEERRRRRRDDDRDENRSRSRKRGEDDRDESRSRRRGENDQDESRSSRRRREDDRDESASRRRREDERGESSRRAEDRRTTRGRERDSYDDDDDYDGDRKRRRWKSEDPGRRGVGRAQTWG